jgi:peroxiredoxin
MSTLAIALLVSLGGAVEFSPRHDFEFAGAHDQRMRLSDYADRDIVVLVFFGTECPLARIYAPRINALAGEYSTAGVTFLGIDPNDGDSLDDLARFARHYGIHFPLFKDPEGSAARRFGATRQLEVFVLDHHRNVKYHGRVDDQYAPGFPRTEPERHDLNEALEELLSGNSEITVPVTEVAVCLADYSPQPITASAAAPLWSESAGQCVDDGDASCAQADVADAEPGAGSQETASSAISRDNLPETAAVSPPQMTGIALALIFTIACWLVGRRRAQPPALGWRG